MLRSLLVFMSLALAAHNTASAEEATDFEGWYQVDVIAFKPRRVDLDDESWPTIEPSYPWNTVAVTGAGIFRISQLENLQAPLLPEEASQLPVSRQRFAFEDSSSAARNRRVIESLQGRAPAQEVADQDPDAETTLDEPSLAARVQQIISELDPVSPGRLAFSSTINRSSLAGFARSLNRSSRYDVLAHHSWVQPIGGDATPVLIQAGDRHDDLFELEGTLSVTRSRFLHVTTDLWYRVFERRSDATLLKTELETTLSDAALAEYPELVRIEEERGQYYPARMHVMRQSRRMRSDELHYIDHPLFGIVIKINRFSPEPQ